MARLIIPLVMVGAVLFATICGEMDVKIRQLQIALNETQDALTAVTQNLSQVSTQLELERALVTNGQAVRNFKSKEELEAFLASDDTDQHQHIKDTFDCDDFAMMLQERAFQQGFIINCQKLPIGGLNHMNNLAICGNDIYFVEAETDVISYAGFLD